MILDLFNYWFCVAPTTKIALESKTADWLADNHTTSRHWANTLKNDGLI